MSKKLYVTLVTFKKGEHVAPVAYMSINENSEDAIRKTFQYAEKVGNYYKNGYSSTEPIYKEYSLDDIISILKNMEFSDKEKLKIIEGLSEG